MNKYSKISGKSSNKAKGDRGEIIAAGFLEKIGYKIIKTKFGKGRGEIDIIAESESGVLNFIGVKTRFGSKFGKQYESADKKKIIDASNFFLINSNIDREKRLINYGIISIEYIECNSIKLIFFENIFE
ncbi:YraN family protein [Candidatus Acidulodesulfobacterium sp. H_13]|uniref:YraN family protein n=1 Tax=Candidatus Acidulodesulfobacterium sp. H_13 TaxID=3395470 RepID=UPI003AF938D2